MRHAATPPQPLVLELAVPAVQVQHREVITVLGVQSEPFLHTATFTGIVYALDTYLQSIGTRLCEVHKVQDY